MWEAWSLSKEWKTRPSEFYFIEDEVTAWCFDRAVTTFGTAVEDSIKKAMDKAKNGKQAEMAGQRQLRKWLNRAGDTRGLFRDPAARG